MVYDPRPDEITTLEADIAALHERLRVARLARPPQPVTDYVFRRGDDRTVSLSALFGAKDELLIVHNMGRHCPYCTLWADTLNGMARHLHGRAAFAVATPDAPADMREFARERGWTFDIVSCAGTTFAEDLGYASRDQVMPGVSALRRRNGQIERINNADFGPGDPYCGLWHLFDLLPDGAAGWQPTAPTD